MRETLHLSYTLLLLARAHLREKSCVAGRDVVREGLSWTRDRDQRYLEAEFHRVDGELAFEAGDIDFAQSALQNAIDVATRQRAHWLALRALHAYVSRFGDTNRRQQLAALVAELPSGHQLPPFRAALSLLETAH